jgi:hypothetical protein
VQTNLIGEFLHMKKGAITVVGVLALAASANADPPRGTWYTNQALWQSLVSNVSTATYTTVPSGSSPWTEAGVTAAAASGSWVRGAVLGSLSTQNVTPVTFTFNGNSFGGLFSLNYLWRGGRYAQPYTVMNFSIDGSITNTQSFTTSNNYTFLGYISNSATPISLTASNSAYFVDVDSFSFGQSTSSLGANVAPEPGTLALALTGGCALLGMFIHRRKAA